ncbi:MAG: response regulator [Patescibacteria group bacterium]
MTEKFTKKVLIVEDDIFLTNIYRQRLQDAGYIVEATLNGEECLERMKLFKPDIILLDIIMPKTDGFETLKAIKANKDHNTIPIIVVSNLSERDDIDRAYSLGASDYIIKSDVPIEHIIQRIQELF